MNASQWLLYSFYLFFLMFPMPMIAELCEKTMSFLIFSWMRACMPGVLHVVDTCPLGQRQGVGVIFMCGGATQM